METFLDFSASIIDQLQEQILLLDGNRFTQEPVKILNEVEDFLGIQKFFSDSHFDFSGKKGYPCFRLDDYAKCMSNNKAREHPPMNAESLKYLRNHYRPVLDRFKTQTGMEIKLS